MPPIDICGQLSSDCVTIDRTREEALLNARMAFYGPSVGPLHKSTRVAVNNLLTCLGADPGDGRVMIVGHGAPGVIVTGTGTVASDQDKRIAVPNFNRWKGSVDELSPQISELTFCSCETGAGDQGAEVLMKVADLVDAQVSGFTAMIFIDATGNITCEPGGVWQHAQPEKLLPSISAPMHRFGKIVDLKLKYGDKYRTVKIKRVSAVSFFEPGEKGKRVFSLRGEAAQRLVRTINFAKPSEIDGAPLALTTGRLEIEYVIDEKPDERIFVIFNDRLLLDQATPNTFYFASPDLAEALYQLRPKNR